MMGFTIAGHELEEVAIFIALILAVSMLLRGSVTAWATKKLLTPTTLLATVLGLMTGLYLVIVDHNMVSGNTGKAIFFGVLYFWSVIGMLFFASHYRKNTKLYLGILAMGGVLYMLYRTT